MAEHASTNGSVRFIGTATTLITWRDLTVLTDPNFLHRGQYAYLGKGLVSRRRTEPALAPEDLPHLDAVVLSHLHGDHFDRIARRRLHREVPVLTTPKAATRLHQWGFSRSVGLRTWRHHTLAAADTTLRVTAVPGRHAPRGLPWLLPPVMGTVLDFSAPGAALRVYVTGDTLLFPGLAEIRDRFPGIDLMVVHLGGTTLPGGLVVTMDGRAGARLADLLRPGRVLPVHYDDYTVFRSGLADFLAAMRERGLGADVTVVAPGESLAL
ncbi:MBL fold metallo-hydrolase [Streptomonospora nanhaiensis]|uniref:MBL fold metallo-hydrolase n=1 Tax=Streptomonospora nanhaiensis TaxID=1323731 RepID=UPI001C387AF8|nr:MBL fold metallo-hydrolase [Streptomonospora nanhaiensis]MBV2364573.1 MBL fold metallo-hydrolase [Streptomonospora nanhaiensis]